MNKRRFGLTVAVCMLVTALAAGAYFCLRLSSGAPEDLPQQSLQTLAELGWLTLPLPTQSNVFSQAAA